MTPLTPETLAELERLLADITPGRDKPFVRLTMRNWSTICNAAPALIAAARRERALREAIDFGIKALKPLAHEPNTLGSVPSDRCLCRTCQALGRLTAALSPNPAPAERE